MNDMPESVKTGLKTLRNPVVHHAPYEASKLPRYSRFGYVSFGTCGDTDVLASETVIGFIRIGNHFRTVPLLPLFQVGAFPADPGAAITVCSFYQQPSQVRISCFRYGEPVTGI